MPNRPLPIITSDTAAFWTGGAENKLFIHRCAACGHYTFPPLPVCPECLSDQVAPQVVSGRGEVAAFTICRHPFLPDMKIPFCAAIVELDEQEGLRIWSNVVNCPLESIHIGMQVSVVFEQNADVWIPLFQPAQS